MEKTNGIIPEIRFPEFNDPWEYRKLSDLLSESKNRNEELKYGKDEVLSVSGELGVVNQIEHLGRSYAGESVHNYHIVETGDIVYTKSPLKANPFGIIKLNKGKPGIVSTLYAVYKVNTKTAYGPFLDYYFSLDANTNRYLRPLVKKGAKNDMKVNNAYVLYDKIYVPSIEEQERIASIFSIIDQKLYQLGQRKILLEQYKRGIMQKLFSREIRFKDSKGNNFSEWKQKQLNEVAEINPKIENLPDSFIYIDLESVVQGRLTREERILKKEAPSRAQRLLKKNDILFQMVRPYQQNNFFFDRDDTDVVASTGYAQIRTLNNPDFLYQLLHEESFVKKVIEKCTGTGYPAINSTDLSTIAVNIPLEGEQIKIASFLTSIDDKIRSASNQIEVTRIWKKGLLQAMFC